VSLLIRRDGTSLDQILINADQTNNVAARNILNLLNKPSHHQDSPLDLLDVKIGLGAGDKVGPHDPAPETGLDNTGEDPAESVEPTFVGSRDHF